MKTVSITVERRFDVPSERVFDAWLKPELLGKWMFGPSVREEEIIHLQNEPVTGGKFSFKVLRSGETIDHIGTYLILQRPERLSFTWGIAGLSVEESVVDIHISPEGEGCRLVLTHEVWQDYADRTKQGWGFMLDKLNTINHD